VEEPAQILVRPGRFGHYNIIEGGHEFFECTNDKKCTEIYAVQQQPKRRGIFIDFGLQLRRRERIDYQS